MSAPAPVLEAVSPSLLAGFGLDALYAGAAQRRPEAPTLENHGSGAGAALTAGGLDQAIGAFYLRLRDFDFSPGERVLLLCAPGAQAVAALAGSIGAGLSPVLAPVHLEAEQLAEAALACTAAAIFAPARFAGLDLEDRLLAAAARAPSVRMIGVLTPGAFDGAEDFSFQALRGAPIARAQESHGPSARARVGVVEAGVSRYLTQEALLTRALTLARLIRRDGEAPALSLVSCASFAGLVAGPLAALLSGAPLHFLAPFSTAEFLDALDSIGPARLVAPRALAPFLAEAGLLTSGALLSVTLIAQKGAAQELAVEPAGCPIVDIVASGVEMTIAPRLSPALAPARRRPCA